MRSARHKKFAKRWRNAKASGEKGRVLGIFYKVVIALLVGAGIFLFVRLRTVYWNGHDKLAFTYKMSGGEIGVTVADPKLDELTTLVIPGDTQVDVAENYGTLRLKNVWQLSENEKKRGRLLPETVTQNFLFPTFLWTEANVGTLKFIFSPGSTNIPFGDRLNLSIFAMRVLSLGRSEINLGESQYLRKQKLDDGLVGYVLNGQPSGRLTVYFSDNDITVAGSRVNIVDATGSFGVADKVGQIIEVIGGKVVSVEKKDTSVSDCEIIGRDQKLVKKIAALFACTTGRGSSDIDLEIKLGQNFAKRF